MWKRAEEAKFKAYLKQKEIATIEEVTIAWKAKEQERERTFNESVSKVCGLEKQLRTKGMDLQRREERIFALEEELKNKLLEVSKQLTNKEEEIVGTKKRFKEEKVLLENDKKRLVMQVEDLKNRLEHLEQRHYSFKKEVDESPVAVLRQELSQKNVEVIEAESKVRRANEEAKQYKA